MRGEPSVRWLPGLPGAFVNLTDVDLGRFRKYLVGRRKDQSDKPVSWEHVFRFEDSKLSMFRDGNDRVGFVWSEFFFQAKTAQLREERSGIRRIVFAFFPGLGVFGAV